MAQEPEAKSATASAERRKRRVLLLTPRLADTGPGRLCTDLALHLDPERFEPVVCCYDGWGPLARELEQAGVEIFMLRRRRGIDLTYMFALASEMRERDIDMVHSLHASKAYIVGVLSGLLARVPKGVASFHDRPEPDQPLLSRAGRLCGEVVGRVVASSDAVRESLLKRRWVPPGKTEVIPDGIHLARYEREGEREAAREHWDVPPGVPLIGGVVDGDAADEVALLESTFDRLGRELPEARFVVSGVHGTNTPRTLFLGPHADNPAFFRAIDHLCLPRAGRVVPVTLLEALAAEVPVTAGREEFGDDVAPEGPWAFAQLVPPTPADLAEGILDLVRDEHAARTLARPGKTCVRERFSMERYASSVQSLYERLM